MEKEKRALQTQLEDEKRVMKEEKRKFEHMVEKLKSDRIDLDRQFEKFNNKQQELDSRYRSLRDQVKLFKKF